MVPFFRQEGEPIGRNLETIGPEKGQRVPICSVVIPAAGSSSRMEGIDKILEPLGELPVLVRTLQVFQSCDLVHEVIVVTREDLIVP